MGYFLDEVREQGKALRHAAEKYRDEGGHLIRDAARMAGGRPVLFAGMGSSWAAALAAEAYLVRAGKTAFAVDASEALYRWLPVLNAKPAPLPVLISQSGESREVVAIAARLSTPYVAVTNSPGSSLARKAAAVLPLHAGEEKGVTNKTFTNSVAILGLLARALLAARDNSGERISEVAALLEIAEFMEAANGVEAVLARPKADVEGLYRHLSAGDPARRDGAGARPLPWEVIGRGSARAAVEQGALTLRELTGRVLAPFTGGHYRHGPVYRAGEWTRAIVLASKEEEGNLLVHLTEEIVGRGGRVAFISDFEPEVDSPLVHHFPLPPVARCLFPVLAVIPLELLGLADAEERGFEAGVGVPKITPSE